MADYIFSWFFTLAVYLILPETMLTRLQTLIALTVFAFTGLYVYSVIEKRFNKYKRSKRHNDKVVDGIWEKVS